MPSPEPNTHRLWGAERDFHPVGHAQKRDERDEEGGEAHLDLDNEVVLSV